jgi:hypothetical protein
MTANAPRAYELCKELKKEVKQSFLDEYIQLFSPGRRSNMQIV